MRVMLVFHVCGYYSLPSVAAKGYTSFDRLDYRLRTLPREVGCDEMRQRSETARWWKQPVLSVNFLHVIIICCRRRTFDHLFLHVTSVESHCACAGGRCFERRKCDTRMERTIVTSCMLSEASLFEGMIMGLPVACCWSSERTDEQWLHNWSASTHINQCSFRWKYNWNSF